MRERIGLGAADARRFPAASRSAPRSMRETIAPRWSASEVTLRLGAKAHLVHYPLRGGSLVNLVAAIESGWRGEEGDPPLGRRRGPPRARPRVRRLVARRARADRRRGRLARLAALSFARRSPAFRSGAVALHRRRRASDDAVSRPRGGAGDRGRRRAGAAPGRIRRRCRRARRLFADRVARASRVQRDALAQGRIYHLSGPLAFARDVAMRVLGPRRLLDRYDWLYAA